MMSAHSHRRPPIPQRAGWWRALQIWQRVIVVSVLLGVLVIAAATILAYFLFGIHIVAFVMIYAVRHAK